MTKTANQLVTNDPYATSVRLLQYGGLAEPASACLSLSPASVEALAFLAHTTESAEQVVTELAGMGVEDLASLLNLDHEAEAVAFQRRLAFRATGLRRRLSR
jgi:hypothetical protein